MNCLANLGWLANQMWDHYEFKFHSAWLCRTPVLGFKTGTLNSVGFRATMVAMKSASLPGKLEIPQFDSDLRRSGQDSGEGICCP
jgi:hypothetical protein